MREIFFNNATRTLFMGGKPLAENTKVEAEFYRRDNTRTIVKQTILAFRAVPPRLGKFINDLEHTPLLVPSIPFREMGGLYFEYEDGSGEEKIVTSNEPMHISGAVVLEALQRSRVFNELEAGHTPRIIDIHTHPGAEYQPPDQKHPILINDHDFSMYQTMAAMFSAYAGREIQVHGLVRPVGKNCGNVIIGVTASAYDPDGAAKALAQKIRTQRNTAKIFKSFLDA